MAAPKWQPGTVYIPGDIVQPVSGSPVAGQPIVNPNFNGNANGWTLPPQFSYDGSSSFQSGTGSVRFDTVGNGFYVFKATDGVPVSPGRSITASCMCQQGASDAGLLALQVLISWYNSSDVEISSKLGTLVNSGSGGAWSQSTVTDVAPAGSAYVRIGAACNRIGQNLPAWIDNFVWNYTGDGTPAGLIYKAVQPASGISGATEPVWPSVLGVQVVDNTVTWEAIAATRVTWEASPVLVSGATEPNWPTQVGESVADGSIKWTAFSRRVEDENCPNSKVVAIVASKVFAVDRDIVRYCATANPLDWTSEKDAGYLPTGLQQANANDMAVLNQYRSNLVAFNASSFQNWQADPDPEVMAILDQIDGVGSIWQQAAKPVGNELFYLSQLGVRTIGIAGASTNLQAGDVGMPVDPIVQEAIRVAVINGSKALATYYPSAGQYWLTFANYPPNEITVIGDLPDGDINSTVSYQFHAGGGIGPLTFSIVSGALPTGLSMDANGLVTGTRTGGGVFTFTVRAADGYGNFGDQPDTSETYSDPLWLQVLSLIKDPAAMPITDRKTPSPPLWGWLTVQPSQAPVVNLGDGPFGDNTVHSFVSSSTGKHFFTATTTGGSTPAVLKTPTVPQWTAEALARWDNTTGTQVLFSLAPSGGNDMTVRIVGGVYQVSTATGGTNLLTGPAASTTQYQHVALTRDGSGNVRLFVDGVMFGPITHPAQMGGQFTWGAQANSNSPANVRLSNMRLTAACRYTSNFTPPTRPFPAG